MSEIQDKPLSMYLIDVNKLFFEKIKAKTNKLGINPSYRLIFMILAKNEKGLTQKEICDFTHFKASSISLLLQQMENEGLITREKATDDNRKTIVCLTKKGKDLDDRLKLIFKETDITLKESLSKEQYENLISYLTILSDSLKDGDK